ncbi:hypothetical protein BA724_13595 [Domibacillus iocasae]|uniref:Uncharacterized protein n=1 Tax=Domibacillus iocasae TaxID=1714016 RepID=A0A1E7DK38_9BACI|nr:hypothetical protein BA724_13595 [Domibacillus iocasae]
MTGKVDLSVTIFLLPFNRKASGKPDFFSMIFRKRKSLKTFQKQAYISFYWVYITIGARKKKFYKGSGHHGTGSRSMYFQAGTQIVIYGLYAM